MRVVVFQVVDHDSQERTECGFVEFTQESARRTVMVIDEAEVKVQGGKVIYLSSAYDPSNDNASIFVREDQSR